MGQLRRLGVLPVISLFLLSLAGPGYSPSINVEELSSAQAFDIGTLDAASGGLDQSLWQGTSAVRAVSLMESAPVTSSNPDVMALTRAAILSGGVPPRADTEEDRTRFETARLQTILASGDIGAAQMIVSRSVSLAEDNQLSADMALLAGEYTEACSIADTIVEERGAPKWARLRAFCHVLRDEIPAAELTTEVLKNSGYEDPAFFSLMKTLTGQPGNTDFGNLKTTPLYTAMVERAGISWPGGRTPHTLAARTALDSAASPDARLTALYTAGHALSGPQYETVLTDLSVTESQSDLAGAAEYDIDAALAAPVPLGTGQLFTLSKSGPQDVRAKAIASLLKRASDAGSFGRFATLLTPQIQSLSPEKQVGSHLELFARAAVNRSDTATLQRLYARLEDSPAAQERIALAADAIGYGFVGGALGTDIESRLLADGQIQARAARDMLIAHAMGAAISDQTISSLESIGIGEGRAAAPGALIALQSAASTGARAETALRAAQILAKGNLDNPSLFTVLRALNDAGLTQFSGRVAARDFLRGLPK